MVMGEYLMSWGSDVLNNGSKLKFRREDNGATEAAVSINLFKPIMPKHILENQEIVALMKLHE